MDDFDGDGIINTEDPYPLDACYPGNFIKSVDIPLIGNYDYTEADFDIYTITGNKVLTLGTIGFNINDYLENFCKALLDENYNENGSSYYSDTQRINLGFSQNNELKLYISSLNNKCDAESLLYELLDNGNYYDRDYKQGYEQSNLPNESIINLGKIVELFGKKENPGYTLQELVKGLYYFLTGKECEYSTDILKYFEGEGGRDPYFRLDSDVLKRFGLPNASNDSLWDYLSYDTVVFSSIYDNDIIWPIKCTGLHNHILYSPYLDYFYTNHCEENYSRYMIEFNNSELDLERMVAIKVLLERKKTFPEDIYTAKIFISGKDVIRLNDLDPTGGEYIKFINLNESGFNVMSDNQIIYDIKKDDGNFKYHIYKLFGDTNDDDIIHNEKLEKEIYSFFFFLIPHKENLPEINQKIVQKISGSLNGHDSIPYKIVVPDNEIYDDLEITVTCPGGVTDFDIYIQYESLPVINNGVVTDYCAYGKNTGDDKVNITFPSSGTWWVLVYNFSGNPGTYVLEMTLTPDSAPAANADWAFIGSTVHFWPPADRNTIVAKVDGNHNITEGPYVLPYEYLCDPGKFTKDSCLIDDNISPFDPPIYKLDLTISKLLNLFTIDANEDEKLLFVQGAYGLEAYDQPAIEQLENTYLFMKDDENIYFPLTDHCLKIDGLSDTNENNRVVNKFIDDFNANAYIFSFDHVCGVQGWASVELPVSNYYHDLKTYAHIVNKVLFTVKGIVPPPRPSGLVLEVTEPETDVFNIIIDWEYSSEDKITHFRIERKTGDEDFTTIADEIGVSTRRFTDTNILSNTEYSYRVLSVNCAGAVATSVQSIKTPQTIPAPPSDLSAAAVSHKRIRLAWNDNSHNENGFKIKRNDLEEDIVINEANVTTYQDSYALLPETSYTYTVRSFNELGDSPESAEAAATTLGSELSPEVAGISCDIVFQQDMYGIPDRWIPNTNELCRPFSVVIRGRDADNGIFEIPENLGVSVIAPEDPFWQEGDEDEAGSNIHRNK
ncbi:MAG: fibronectin type III domain-containing protein, partial [Spirochaetales bacterium]|nr:fibronectin type III domain-containing protein [Spirochaetales bacterium]